MTLYGSSYHEEHAAERRKHAEDAAEAPRLRREVERLSYYRTVLELIAHEADQFPDEDGIGAGTMARNALARASKVDRDAMAACPTCGGTSVGTVDHPPGRSWSRAGACHLGDDTVTPLEYVPAVEGAA